MDIGGSEARQPAAWEAVKWSAQAPTPLRSRFGKNHSSRRATIGFAPARYTSSREVFSTEAIAAVSRFQLSVSTRSRLRPVAVSW